MRILKKKNSNPVGLILPNKDGVERIDTAQDLSLMFRMTERLQNSNTTIGEFAAVIIKVFLPLSQQLELSERETGHKYSMLSGSDHGFDPSKELPVHIRAKNAALHALGRRNPRLPLSVEERERVQDVVRGAIDGDITKLEQEAQRLGEAAKRAQHFLDSDAAKLSPRAVNFLKNLNKPHP